MAQQKGMKRAQKVADRAARKKVAKANAFKQQVKKALAAAGKALAAAAK